ncbi:MAG TPA: efflux RND transporter periplasmic adaptor subunit [Nitrospiraceae bacterium]
MTRQRFIGIAAVFIIAAAAFVWLVSRPVVLPPADSKEDLMMDMPGMEKSGVGKKDAQAPPLSEKPDESDLPAESGGPSGTISIPPERLQTIGVKYQPVTRRPLEKLIRTVGRVVVDERRLAKVTIKFHGWIEQLFVSATGDHVKKGQKLFTIYSPDLVATQEEYLLALQSRKQLGESEIPEVAAGSKDLLEATRHRLHLWDIGEEHIRDLERTKQVTKTLPLHSPISGTVISKNVLQGTHVEPGEELYTIADLSHIWILADIYEYELSFVKIGQQAAVTLSYDPGTVLSGQVGFVYPTLDPKTRTAKVRFELDNAEEKLKPDMYANVELRVSLGTKLAIPKEAVIESGKQQVVFLHHGGGKLEPRLIKTGVKTEEFLEVLEGLKEGEHIVTSANFLIDSESRLKSVVESMSGMSGMKPKD